MNLFKVELGKPRCEGFMIIFGSGDDKVEKTLYVIAETHHQCIKKVVEYLRRVSEGRETVINESGDIVKGVIDTIREIRLISTDVLI